jgi:hypothetical protein
METSRFAEAMQAGLRDPRASPTTAIAVKPASTKAGSGSRGSPFFLGFEFCQIFRGAADHQARDERDDREQRTIETRATPPNDLTGMMLTIGTMPPSGRGWSWC